MVTVEDIVKKRFSRAVLGYDIGEVDLFLDAVIEQFEAYERERKEMMTAMDYLLKELEQFDGVMEGVAAVNRERGLVPPVQRGASEDETPAAEEAAVILAENSAEDIAENIAQKKAGKKAATEGKPNRDTPDTDTPNETTEAAGDTPTEKTAEETANGESAVEATAATTQADGQDAEGTDVTSIPETADETERQQAQTTANE